MGNIKLFVIEEIEMLEGDTWVPYDMISATPEAARELVRKYQRMSPESRYRLVDEETGKVLS